MLKRLDCPTLVIHGAADLLIRPDAAHHTAACIKGAELVIVPGWGHNMPIGAVDAITAPMIDFMRRHHRTNFGDSALNSREVSHTRV
jgi:pimeloyl-ACP methyl ester carboxylesterase